MPHSPWNIARRDNRCEHHNSTRKPNRSRVHEIFRYRQCDALVRRFGSDEFCEQRITEDRQTDKTVKGKIDRYTYINNPTTRQGLQWRRNVRCSNDSGIMRLSSASRIFACNPTVHCSETRVNDVDVTGSSVFGRVRDLQKTSVAPTTETFS